MTGIIFLKIQKSDQVFYYEKYLMVLNGHFSGALLHYYMYKNRRASFVCFAERTDQPTRRTDQVTRRVQQRSSYRYDSDRATYQILQ